jgi:hypothetical protein
MLMSLTSGGSALYQKGGGGGLESLRCCQPCRLPCSSRNLIRWLPSRCHCRSALVSCVCHSGRQHGGASRNTVARVRRYRYHDHLTHSGRPGSFRRDRLPTGERQQPRIRPQPLVMMNHIALIITTSQQEILHLVYSTLPGSTGCRVHCKLAP